MTMNPYLNVIQITVQKLPEQNPEARAIVYERARESLRKQVQKSNPPVSETGIEDQWKTLELAIAKVEQQYSSPCNSFCEFFFVPRNLAMRIG